MVPPSRRGTSRPNSWTRTYPPHAHGKTSHPPYPSGRGYSQALPASPRSATSASYAPHRHQQYQQHPYHSPVPPPPPPPIEPVLEGPHPSFIQVAQPYVFDGVVHECIMATGVDPLREDTMRLVGINWIDQVRRELELPVRTFNTAAIYFHKFRLVHSDAEYHSIDAAAAALFVACKIEDTLKKSREILCCAFNLKLHPSQHLTVDDPYFESQSYSLVGLERLMLESSGFDFRNRYPQKLLLKLIKHFEFERDSKIAEVAYGICLDLYRTFAPLKQTSSTMAFACLELAGRLLDARSKSIEDESWYSVWVTSRAEVMETMLDLLEVYTHYRGQTKLGPQFESDLFLNTRIPLNQEAESRGLPRSTYSVKKNKTSNGVKENGLKQVINPLTPKLVNIAANKGSRAVDNPRAGTLRFILDPDQAKEEREIVEKYFKVEMEEIEVED